MMSKFFDMAVVEGRVVLTTGVQPGGIGIRDGRIAEVLRPGETVQAERKIDAGGSYILPGLIDSHVHFRNPGLAHKEDWKHASRAAVAGGVTTVFDMPNTQPALLDDKQLDERVDMVTGQSLVDFGFHLGVDPACPQRLRGLPPGRFSSVKVFMAGHHTAPHVVRDRQALDTIFSIAADKGLQVVLHAEDENIFRLLDASRGPVRTYDDFEPSRPRSAAIVAVAHIIELVQRHGTKAHVLHVSSKEEVDLLSAARSTGLPVSFEVTGHHLAFSNHDVVRLGSRIRLSPAIREPADRERLWQAVLQQEVATLGSDHAPHSMQEKLRPAEHAPPGIPGVQELLSTVFTGLRRRQPNASIDEHMELIVQLCAARPAQMFGLADRKGNLAPGMDADLVVFDPTTNWAMRPQDIQSKCGWSAYEGWLLTGAAQYTVRRGQVMWDGHNRCFGEATGRWVFGDRDLPAQRAPSPAATPQPTGHLA